MDIAAWPRLRKRNVYRSFRRIRGVAFNRRRSPKRHGALLTASEPTETLQQVTQLCERQTWNDYIQKLATSSDRGNGAGRGDEASRCNAL